MNVPAVSDGAVLDVDVDPKSPLYRSKCSGDAPLGATRSSALKRCVFRSPTTIVFARNAGSPSKGSFELTFSATRVP